MVKTWFRKRQLGLDWEGATVIGPSHLAEGLPNQDAILIHATKQYWLGVVCDGLGSAKNSDKGAKMATLAVRQAIQHWETADCEDISLLLKLIINLWRVQIPKEQRRDYNTTCLLALLRKDGSGVLAQLGDGLILLVNEVGQKLLTPNKAFGNQTGAIGSIRKLEEWEIYSFEGFGPNSILMLATDGISDDLNEGTEQEFCRYLIETLLSNWSWQRKPTLENVLENWPTPKHADDKTICLAWNKYQNK